MTTKQLIDKLEKLRQTEFVCMFVDDISGHSFEQLGLSQWYKVQTFLSGEWYCFVEDGQRFKYSQVFKLV